MEQLSNFWRWKGAYYFTLSQLNLSITFLFLGFLGPNLVSPAQMPALKRFQEGKKNAVGLGTPFISAAGRKYKEVFQLAGKTGM